MVAAEDADGAGAAEWRIRWLTQPRPARISTPQGGYGEKVSRELPKLNYGTADRVRFGEIDALHHVNHTAYLRWFETFRISYFRDYGLSDYGPDSPRIVLKSITAEFIKEMVFGQDYMVTGRTVSFRKTSWVMDYAVWTDQGLQATGSSVRANRSPQPSSPATARRKPSCADSSAACG